jgi:hypothetical protein
MSVYELQNMQGLLLFYTPPADKASPDGNQLHFTTFARNDRKKIGNSKPWPKRTMVIPIVPGPMDRKWHLLPNPGLRMSP